MIVNHGTSVQNNYYWLSSLMDSYALSEDLDYLAHYDDLVRSLSAKQLQQLAKKYVNLKNYVAVSLRPENPDAGQAD